MGFIKKIFKGVKKVVKGIGKVFKKVFKSKVFKFLAIAAGVFMGGASLGLWAAPQTGFMGGLYSVTGKILGAPMRVAKSVLGIPQGGQGLFNRTFHPGSGGGGGMPFQQGSQGYFPGGGGGGGGGFLGMGGMDPYTRGIVLQMGGSVVSSLAKSAQERKERKRQEEGALAAADAMKTGENPYIPRGEAPAGGPPGVDRSGTPLDPAETGVPRSIDAQGAQGMGGYVGSAQTPEGARNLYGLHLQRTGGTHMTGPLTPAGGPTYVGSAQSPEGASQLYGLHLQRTGGTHMGGPLMPSDPYRNRYMYF